MGAAGQFHLDHITIAGRSLPRLLAQFAAIGIPAAYGGRHSNGLTEMALAGLADGSYLELIAAQTPAGAAAHPWGPFIDGDAGPCAWAISVTDIAAEARRFHASVEPGGRTRADGVELHWRTAAIGPGPPGSFFPFLIEDVTPRELRVPRPGQPSHSRVERVILAVRDGEQAADRYRDAFDLPAPEWSADARLQARVAHFAGTPVVLAEPAGAWLERRLETFGEAPCAFVLQGGLLLV